LGDEPIWHDGRVIGWVTSGAFGHRVGESLALGYIPAELKQQSNFEIELLGERRAALKIEASAYDPSGAKMRS
jgi:dimethylglycine dehydrogenase